MRTFSVVFGFLWGIYGNSHRNPVGMGMESSSHSNPDTNRISSKQESAVSSYKQWLAQTSYFKNLVPLRISRIKLIVTTTIFTICVRKVS